MPRHTDEEQGITGDNLRRAAETAIVPGAAGLTRRRTRVGSQRDRADFDPREQEITRAFGSEEALRGEPSTNPVIEPAPGTQFTQEERTRFRSRIAGRESAVIQEERRRQVQQEQQDVLGQLERNEAGPAETAAIEERDIEAARERAQIAFETRDIATETERIGETIATAQEVRAEEAAVITSGQRAEAAAKEATEAETNRVVKGLMDELDVTFDEALGISKMSPEDIQDIRDLNATAEAQLFGEVGGEKFRTMDADQFVERIDEIKKEQAILREREMTPAEREGIARRAQQGLQFREFVQSRATEMEKKQAEMKQRAADFRAGKHKLNPNLERLNAFERQMNAKRTGKVATGIGLAGQTGRRRKAGEQKEELHFSEVAAVSERINKLQDGITVEDGKPIGLSEEEWRKMTPILGTTVQGRGILADRESAVRTFGENFFASTDMFNTRDDLEFWISQEAPPLVSGSAQELADKFLAHNDKHPPQGQIPIRERWRREGEIEKLEQQIIDSGMEGHQFVDRNSVSIRNMPMTPARELHFKVAKAKKKWGQLLEGRDLDESHWEAISTMETEDEIERFVDNIFNDKDSQRGRDLFNRVLSPEDEADAFLEDAIAMLSKTEEYSKFALAFEEDMDMRSNEVEEEDERTGFEPGVNIDDDPPPAEDILPGFVESDPDIAGEIEGVGLGEDEEELPT